MRYQILQDQLLCYKELGASWCVWTYKDLGLQGLVGLLPDSKWIKKIQPILQKKALLGVDSWGGSDGNIRHIMEPLEQAFAEFFPNYQPFPFDAKWQINRAVRHILLAEPLIDDFYPILLGLGLDEIDELMASFLFGNCSPRHGIVEVLRKEQQVSPEM
jgi:endoglucanase